jgi:hypothetical protein
MLAVHNFDSTYGKVPPAWSGQGELIPGSQGSFHYFLLPYIEQDALYRLSNNASNTAGVFNTILKGYLCPLDPSSSTDPPSSTSNTNIQRDGYAGTSYLCNVMVFEPRGTKGISTAMPDGTSNTVTIAEAYQLCYNAADGGWTVPAWAWNPNYGDVWATAAFGMPTDGWNNVLSQRGADYSNGGVAFSIQPRTNGCNWYVTQTGHAGAMSVGMGDGSVRSVSPSVSVQTWVNACTPNDGNPLGSDW